MAGSDAHTLTALGLTHTEVPGASNAAEYLEGLRHGYSRAQGASGDYWSLTHAVAEIGLSLMRERLWAVALAPLLLAVPVITFANYCRELAFNRKWSRQLLGGEMRLTAACAPETAL